MSTCFDRCGQQLVGTPSSVFRANAGHIQAGLEAYIYSLQSEVCLGKHRFVLFRGGERCGGSDDPAKCDNHQQAQEESEPTHVTELGHSAVVLSSIEIAHFGTNMFWCVPARTRPLSLLNR